MKQMILTLAIIAGSFAVYAQEKEPVLYGAIDKNSLAAAPYSKWFDTGYNSYLPDSSIIDALRKLDMKDIGMQVFFGTWCGDSRREVPPFMKLVQALGIPGRNIHLVAVGAGDSLYKQSPQHEEGGKGIFRVPTIIVYRKGVELNRITEFPVYSLERDLLHILSGNDYTSNYRTSPLVRQWLGDGTLLDRNSSTRGLAMQLKQLASGERELNGVGYLLLEQGRKQEALKLFQVNAVLYPESANVLSSLGEAYYKNGDAAAAIQSLEKALELNKDPQQVKTILKILYQAKGVKG